jgi:hypothetical protein
MTNTSSSPSPFSLPTALAAAAAASAGAGLVHAAAAGTHNGDATVAWLFAATAASQLGWAVLVLARPHRCVLATGIALNAGVVVAWVLSRTVGLVGPLAEVEAVGTQDLLAAVLGTAAVAAGAVALVRRPAGAPASLPVVTLATVAVLALAMPAMAAEHVHGDGHAHDHDEAAAHQHAGAADHGHSEHEGTEASAAEGPVVSIDDPRLTERQRKRGQQLIDETRAAMAAFPDEASILAAGYVSIGDGRRVGGFEHFVKHEHLADDKEIDASAIESIVTQRQADGTKRVVSAMYILSWGSTMEDVPHLAGELSVWHDHQNLCWDPSGQRLAGVLVDGVCRPGGVLRATAPMLHVWLEDTPCGPFSGIEGHGGDCAHAH